MVDSLSYFIPTSAAQLVYQKPWYFYPVCGMVNIKDPLLLTGKNSPGSGGSRFHFSLSEWFFTKCLMPYNRK